MEIGDVVQFNEKHKWTGSLGIITEKKNCGENGIRYMVGVPVPMQGTAYIFCMEKDMEIEYIGKAILVAGGNDE